MKLPKLRTENLIEQNLKNETLIYDLNTNQAFNLNETSTLVYQACSREMTFAELKNKYQFSDDFIYLALDELKRRNLLMPESSYISPFAGISRREVIRQVGLASMIALPLIIGITAPSAAHAASGVITGCQTNVCYASGFALCNACPGRPNVQFYNSQNGSCVSESVHGFNNCTPGQYTVRDAKVISVS